MADPDYIVDGVLEDTEAWVAIASAEPNNVDVQWTTGTGTQNWSQYQDLFIVAYWQSYTGSTYTAALLNFNNDTTANHYRVQHAYNHSTTEGYWAGTQASADVAYISGRGSGTNNFAGAVINIFDINSAHNKVVTSQSCSDWNGGSSVSGFNMMISVTWPYQAAITEIDLSTSSGFSLGTRLDLFGILPRMVS